MDTKPHAPNNHVRSIFFKKIYEIATLENDQLRELNPLKVICYFELKESLPPHPIPIPTPTSP